GPEEGRRHEAAAPARGGRPLRALRGPHEDVNLFTYGTLMSVEGLRDALGERADTLTLRPARLPGWRRIWNVFRPEWNGGVLNLEPSPNDVVVGILVEGLTEEDLQLLDWKDSAHLRGASVYVEPLAGEVVPPRARHR